MSSDTSTHKPRRRSGPMALAAFGLLLLLAAFGYTAWLIGRIAPAVEDAQVEPALPLVATAVSVVDDAVAAEETAALRDLLPSVLEGAPSLAYVRVWDMKGHVLAGAARDATDLPALDAATREAAMRSLSDTAWVERTGTLRLLVEQQREVADTLRGLAEAPKTRRIDRMVASNRQAEVTLLVQSLQSPASGVADDARLDLQEAIEAMRAVPEALADETNPQAFVVAADHAEHAGLLLDAECVEARAMQRMVPALPAALTADAPREPAPLSGLWPTVRGRQFLVPLTRLTDAGDEMPAGVAEVVVFTQPGHAVLPALQRDYVGIGLAVVGVLFIVLAAFAAITRRKRRAARQARTPEAV